MEQIAYADRIILNKTDLVSCRRPLHCLPRCVAPAQLVVRSSRRPILPCSAG